MSGLQYDWLPRWRMEWHWSEKQFSNTWGRMNQWRVNQRWSLDASNALVFSWSGGQSNPQQTSVEWRLYY